MSPLVTITTGFGTAAAAKTSAVAHRLVLWMDRFGWGVRPVAAPAPPATPEFSRLEAEVLRLNRERAQIAAENQLLNEIIGRSAAAAAGRLLRRMIPQPAHGFAALINIAGSNVSTLAVRGTSLEHDVGIPVTNEILDRLRQEPLIVRRYEFSPAVRGKTKTLALLDSQSGIVGTDSPEEGLSGEVFLIPVHEEYTLVGAVVTTSLWPAGLRRIEQAEVLGRLGQTILRRSMQERLLEQHENELWLAREMLRLKSIADRATDQPLETLGELTAALCEAADMDRGALFLFSRRATDVVEPVVEAGETLPATIAQEWRRYEAQFAAMTSAAVASSPVAIHGELFDKPRLETMGVHTLWGHAAVWPLRSSGKQLGTLVLSRRNRDILPARSGQLIEWTAELLAQTLRRIYRDHAIRRQARHDGLTDLANRRTFDTLLAGEVDRVRLGLSEECSLLLADLDRFKSINDRHGHQAGDEVLRVIAQLLREHVGRMRVGERSLLARYGGEELAVLLPGVGTAGALRVAEEIRLAIERLAIDYCDKRLNVTVSIGVASCPMHGLGAESLVAAADSALYRAKTEGRNRVCRPQES
ncbi:MAG: GGDEF domain-containing protein [Planctomycetes bacterium]|nr:GGDEF domain-containing protein [Planctomycetota bacterium]